MDKELSAKDPVGTKGAYRGKEAVRFDLDGRQYAVATANEGAESKADYGDRYTFDEAVEAFSKGMEGYAVPGVWRLPTRDELRAFSRLNGRWARGRGNPKGRTFSATPRRYVFLPTAGYVHDGVLHHGGAHGYYWSSSGAYGLFFNSSRREVGYCRRSFGCSVRLFCELPTE